MPLLAVCRRVARLTRRQTVAGYWWPLPPDPYRFGIPGQCVRRQIE